MCLCLTYSTPVANRLEDIDIAARATKMVDMLSDENKKLRDELSAYSKKVSKLQKVNIIFTFYIINYYLLFEFV